jgi:hypothetical protein
MSQVDDSLQKSHQASRGAKPPQTASQPDEERRTAIIVCQRPVENGQSMHSREKSQYGNARTVLYAGGLKVSPSKGENGPPHRLSISSCAAIATANRAARSRVRCHFGLWTRSRPVERPRIGHQRALVETAGAATAPGLFGGNGAIALAALARGVASRANAKAEPRNSW